MGRMDSPFSLRKLKKENGQDASCPFSFFNFPFRGFRGGFSLNFALPYFDFEHERF